MSKTVASLRAYLMQRLLISLYLLWLVSTVVGYFATLHFANQPYDLVLLQRAEAIARLLQLNSEQPRLDRIPELPDGTDPGMPDRVLYTVTDAEGHKLAGSGNTLRPYYYRRGRTGPLFSNGERDGQKTRMVSLAYAHGGTLYQLHVAETTQQRQALIRGILANIVIPQLLLTLIALAVVWYGLKQGLKPLERLRNEVLGRHRDELGQLDAEGAPAEVHPLIDAVNDLLARQKRLLDAQQQFVADAAHQLRTPFAGLKMQSEVALRSNDLQEKQHALEHIHASTEHGIRLVNQLLALARNDAPQHLAPLDLAALAQRLCAQWVPAALEKHADLGYEGADSAWIQGETNSLEEMLNNLIDNAIRYTPEQGRITVSVTATDGTVELAVEDNGPGIPPAQRERVFERFYRILGSGQSGSGIGLAIVAEVAKRHDTSVQLGEAPGGGTRMAVMFRQG